MNTHAGQLKERSAHPRAVAPARSAGLQSAGDTGTDRRPAAVAQRRFSEAANDRPQVKQLRALQERADNGPQAGRLAQLQAMADSRAGRPEAVTQLRPNPQGGVVQRFEPLTMALIGGGLLAGAGALYGGYRYFRHRQRENTFDAIREEQQNQPPTTVNFHPGQPADTPSTVRADQGGVPQAGRTYTIDINADNPVGHGRGGEQEQRIAMIHERTHISADQAYSANRDESLLYPFDEAPDTDGAEYQNFTQAVANRLGRLQDIVAGDGALSAEQRQELLARVNYAGQLIEYDPVINELIAYTREYGIRANSATVKALVVLARENLARRRPGGQALVAESPI